MLVKGQGIWMVTIQNVLDQLTKPVGHIGTTADKLRSGYPESEVKGIATTFVVTHRVLQQAIAKGVNLIITHEGTFYSHGDCTESLEEDPVYQEKRRLMEESGMAIYRFHDGWHRYQPDGIMLGFIQALGWLPYVKENQLAATILNVPPMTVGKMAAHIKEKLGIPFVRVVGDLTMSGTRVGLLVGYRGGGVMAIPLFEKEQLEIIIAGEGPEWETPEYVRDAVYQGKQRALILIGHAASEEPGMKHLADHLAMMFPHIPVHFIDEEPIFQVI